MGYCNLLDIQGDIREVETEFVKGLLTWVPRYQNLASNINMEFPSSTKQMDFGLLSFLS